MHVLLEVGILFSGLMAGICQVKNIFWLLRIEHQCVLIALAHDVEKLVAHGRLLLSHVARLAFQLGMIVG